MIVSERVLGVLLRAAIVIGLGLGVALPVLLSR
jgi:hypothetical protein